MTITKMMMIKLVISILLCSVSLKCFSDDVTKDLFNEETGCECSWEEIKIGNATGYIYSKCCDYGWRDPKIYRFTPNVYQVREAEQLFTDGFIDASMNSPGYIYPGLFNLAYRQRRYSGYFNEKFEPCIYILFLSEEKSDWPMEYTSIEVLDNDFYPETGSAAIHAYVNLKTKKVEAVYGC